MIFISWGCTIYAKLDPQRASFPCRKFLWPLAQSFKQSSCYLRQFREHTNKRTKDLKTLSVFPTEFSKERHTDEMCCSFLEGLVLPSLAGSLYKNVTAVVKPRHSKCQGQDQDSSHEEVLDLLNNQRWETHQKKEVYDQEKVKSTPNPPTQPITCGQQAAAGSSPPSPHSWALLELRELFLVNEPAAFRNLAPWQQLGTKSLNRSSSHCGHLRLGCPARSPPARQCGAPCAKTGGRRQSHHYSCGTIHFKEIIRDFQAPSSGATVPCHCGRTSGASVQNCSAGQASSETAATGVQP